MNPISALKNRDLILWSEDNVTVGVACDVGASIGGMRTDGIAAEPRNVAYFVARTAVCELLCANFVPFAITLATSLCLKRQSELSSGLELLMSELEKPVGIEFSHENYTSPQETSISVTAVGRYHIDPLARKNTATRVFGDMVGLTYSPPLNADTVHKNLPLSKLIELRDSVSTAELIPIGHRGVSRAMEKSNYPDADISKIPKERQRMPGGPGLSFFRLSHILD